MLAEDEYINFAKNFALFSDKATFYGNSKVDR